TTGCFVQPLSVLSPLLCFFFFFLILPRPPSSTLFPYTTLFRSIRARAAAPASWPGGAGGGGQSLHPAVRLSGGRAAAAGVLRNRSEEHTSELQSRSDLVCRLLLEKKKTLLSTRRTHKNNTASHH